MSGPGSIYTPYELAKSMVDWAVRNKEERILDLGVGEGVFPLLVAEKLRLLGASSSQISNQVFGTEISKEVYCRFQKMASEKELFFQNIINGDFLDYKPAEVSVVIGNPPYVRRSSNLQYEKVNSFLQNELTNIRQIQPRQ